MLRFNNRAGRFMDARGRFVAASTVRAVVDQIADATSDRLAVNAQHLLDGQLSLAEWQAAQMRLVKLGHLATATIAHGGAAQMTPARYGQVGALLRSEYRYLRGFAEGIASGRQKLNGSLVARARQYGQGTRATFERAYGADQQTRRYQACRNVLHAQESCSECRALTARGWMPLGALVPVGSRLCRAQCRCTVSYRREPAEAAA